MKILKSPHGLKTLYKFHNRVLFLSQGFEYMDAKGIKKSRGVEEIFRNNQGGRWWIENWCVSDAYLIDGGSQDKIEAAQGS